MGVLSIIIETIVRQLWESIKRISSDFLWIHYFVGVATEYYGKKPYEEDVDDDDDDYDYNIIIIIITEQISSKEDRLKNSTQTTAQFI
jgi:hypothetical protein